MPHNGIFLFLDRMTGPSFQKRRPETGRHVDKLSAQRLGVSRAVAWLLLVAACCCGKTSGRCVSYRYGPGRWRRHGTDSSPSSAVIPGDLHVFLLQANVVASSTRLDSAQLSPISPHELWRVPLHLCTPPHGPGPGTWTTHSPSPFFDSTAQSSPHHAGGESGPMSVLAVNRLVSPISHIPATQGSQGRICQASDVIAPGHKQACPC